MVSPSTLRPGELERLSFWLRHAPGGARLIALYDEAAAPAALSNHLDDAPRLAAALSPEIPRALSRLPDGDRGVLSTWGVRRKVDLLASLEDTIEGHVLLLWLTLEERDAVLDHTPALWSRSHGIFDLRTQGWATTPDPRPLPPLRFSDQADWRREVEFVERALSDRGWQERPLDELTLDLVARRSRLYCATGKHPLAERIAQELLEIARRQGSEHGVAIATNDLGLIRYVAGDLEGAIDRYQRAMALYRETGALAREAVALANLGAAYRDSDRQPEARELFEEALALVQAIGDRWLEASVLNHLGGFYKETGDEAQALTYFTRALDCRREVLDRSGEATTLANLAVAYAEQEAFEEAQEAFEQALAIEREMGNRQTEARILNRLGLLFHRQGDRDPALTHYRQALDLWQDLGDRRNQAVAWHNIGVTYQDLASKLDQERMRDAFKFKIEAPPVSDVTSPQLACEPLSENADKKAVLIAAGREALDAYRQALEIRRALNDQEKTAKVLARMAGVYQMLEDTPSAQTCHEQALAIWETVGDRFMQARTWARIGRIQSQQEEWESALAASDRAFSLLEALDHRPEMVDLLDTLGGNYSDQSAPERALACYSWIFQVGLEEGAVDSFRLFKIREIDPQRAFDLASGALEQQRTRGARAGEARLLGELGELHRYTENYAQAMERYEEALNLSLELDDRQLEAMALKGIADVYSSMGEKEEAHARYAQAAATWRELGNLMAEGRVLSAMTFDVLFDCEKLIPILERKIEVDRAIGLATSGWEQHLDLCRQLVAQKDQ